MKRLTRDEATLALRDLGACGEAMHWVHLQPGTPRQMWKTCPGEYLIWLMLALYGTRKVIAVLCETLRPRIQRLPRSDTQPRRALRAIEMWCRGTCKIMKGRSACRPLRRSSDGDTHAGFYINALLGLHDLCEIVIRVPQYGLSVRDIELFDDYRMIEDTWRFRRLLRKRMPWASVSRKLRELAM